MCTVAIINVVHIAGWIIYGSIKLREDEMSLSFLWSCLLFEKFISIDLIGVVNFCGGIFILSVVQGGINTLLIGYEVDAGE